MKLWAISLCMLLLLSGCDAASEMERGMALRSALQQSEGCTMDVEILADYGGFSDSFSMACTFDRDGNLDFTVTKPDTISGIKGKIAGDKGQIVFDDTVLYYELMADGTISPISGAWVFMKTLRSGYIRSACMEGEQLRLTIDDSFEDGALQVDAWLNSENTPVCADILFGGSRIMSLNIKNLHIL